MIFSSYVFIFVFLPFVWIGYHTLRYFSAHNASKIFLVLASLFFYAFWKVEYLPILLGSIVINFLLSLAITSLWRGDSKLFPQALQSTLHTKPYTSVSFLAKEGGGSRKNFCKFFLILGIVFNLALLGFFKYTDFLLENFNLFSQLLHLDFTIPLPHIVLPLAISFFTFQQIAYLVDCYKSPKQYCKSASEFLDYCLFVTFFPQLIAGPIVHHKEMMPQFKTLQDSLYSKQTRKEYIAKGLFIFSLGLFKKIVIADSFAKWANAGFSAVENGAVLNFFESWATSLSYTFQLYFDFSGYCDMAIGLGLLFGITLPLNFNSPYKARNIADFWRRWHMSLGRFLKEYVYIPLGGNRNEKYKSTLHYVLINKILTLRNLFIVAFLSGVWHGAGWGFVVWGVMHGVAMVVHRIYKDSSLGNICEGATDSHKQNNIAESKTTKQLKNATPNNQKTLNQPFKQKFLMFFYWFLTFNFVNLSWIFFRAENINGALNLIKGMFSGAIILPSFLESKLGFLKAFGVGFEAFMAVFGEKPLLIPSFIILGLCITLLSKNTHQLATKLNNKKMIFAGLLCAMSVWQLGVLGYTPEFLYFNF
ncbi:MBOAT family O-acyltransferase [Helicobacter himalayensis]|uniref:MBOAT family O-acyltransferase n=1 Tax=Helicobacter himalayensis TaxID=1591088 RepID=UPI003D6EC502